MDIGVADESLNGIPYEESSESEEEEDAEETEGEETEKHLIQIEILRSPMFRAISSLQFSPFPLSRCTVFPLEGKISTRETQLSSQSYFLTLDDPRSFERTI